MPKEKSRLMDPGLLAIAESGRNLSILDLVEANALKIELGVSMARFHEKYDLLLTPQMPLEAFEAGKNFPEGRDMEGFLDWCPFTYPFNMTCHPAATINCGFSDGLPIGFQIIAKKDYDVDTFICATALEEALSLKDIWPDI